MNKLYKKILNEALEVMDFDSWDSESEQAFKENITTAITGIDPNWQVKAAYTFSKEYNKRSGYRYFGRDNNDLPRQYNDKELHVGYCRICPRDNIGTGKSISVEDVIDYFQITSIPKISHIKFKYPSSSTGSGIMDRWSKFNNGSEKWMDLIKIVNTENQAVSLDEIVEAAGTTRELPVDTILNKWEQNLFIDIDEIAENSSIKATKEMIDDMPNHKKKDTIVVNIVFYFKPEFANSIPNFMFSSVYDLVGIQTGKEIIEIGSQAFNTELIDIYINNGCKKIGKLAFQLYPGAKIYIPTSVTSIAAPLFEHPYFFLNNPHPNKPTTIILPSKFNKRLIKIIGLYGQFDYDEIDFYTNTKQSLKLEYSESVQFNKVS